MVDNIRQLAFITGSGLIGYGVGAIFQLEPSASVFGAGFGILVTTIFLRWMETEE